MIKTTVSTKGHLIDPHCKYNDGILLEANDTIYDCTLNQTEISSNKNKFYIIQLIQSGSKYVVYIRYGRIGETGRISYKDFSNKSTAIDFFEKQFSTKTGNKWMNKDDFIKKKGKYFLTEIECVDVSDQEDTSATTSESEIELDPRVTDLVKLMSNITYMQNTLVQLEIDIKKMPLGKISQIQIDNAYEILNKIVNEINNGQREEKLIKLSSEFYTLIPCACGRQKPPLINDDEIIGEKMNLLNELSQMVFAIAIIKQKRNTFIQSNIINLYNELSTEIIPLEKTDDMYQILVTYLNNSKASTHHFKFNVLDIFEIKREQERDLYEQYSNKLKNKTLLFHGTRVSNLIGILKNGLVVDPSRLGISVSIAGKMFGMGLYFANSCSKSIQYCAYNLSDNIACLFVAEVALGKMLKKKQADSTLDAKTLPKGYHSTWGLGQSSFEIYDEYDDSTRIPGEKIKLLSKGSGRTLLYDEFIVYHEEQINLRYIIKLKID